MKRFSEVAVRIEDYRTTGRAEPEYGKPDNAAAKVGYQGINNRASNGYAI